MKKEKFTWEVEDDTTQTVTKIVLSVKAKNN